MKKRVITGLLAAMMLMTPASAASTGQVNTADAMNDLQLFLGTDKGYELDQGLNRAQGITLLVRMIGKEAQATQENTAGNYAQQPFTDVANWSAPYVGYAWKNKITNGISETKFGGTNTMTDYMFLSLTLRALGYHDSGAAADFTWNNPYALAVKTGLIPKEEPDTSFTRGDAVQVFWNSLDAKLNGQNKTLAQTLIDQGVFTAQQLEAARNVQQNGRTSHAGIPANYKAYTWEEYQALTPEKQEKFFKIFDNPAYFFAWQTEAKAAYDKEHPSIEIGDGSIDLGDLIDQGGA